MNQHLQYTHGLGAAVVEANTVESSTGNPLFVVSNVPPVSASGMPVLTQPDIYFGINDPGWVVANTHQKELDYQVNSGPNAGTPIETHYRSTGGVPIGGFFRRMALALRLGDFNFLISNQIDSHSRVLFVRDVMSMARKAAPFLTFDSQPYAVIANGEVQYVLDGYTTTDQYPYSQNASGLDVNEGGLPGSFNYVRNAVKVVVNAYTGSIKFYVINPSDPIIQAYRAAFPSMFLPLSLDAHRRPRPPALPERPLQRPGGDAGALPHHQRQRLLHRVGPLADLAVDRGRHAEPVAGADPGDQQRRQRRLDLAHPDEPDLPGGVAAVGQPRAAARERGLRARGQLGDRPEPLGVPDCDKRPERLRRDSTPTSPRGGRRSSGRCRPTPRSRRTPTSRRPLHCSTSTARACCWATTSWFPWTRACSTSVRSTSRSSSNTLPQLKYVIAVFNQDVAIEPTVGQALSAVLGANILGTTPPPSGGSGSGHTAAYYLTQAAKDYSSAQSALQKGNLGQYQDYVNLMNKEAPRPVGADQGRLGRPPRR